METFYRMLLWSIPVDLIVLMVFFYLKWVEHKSKKARAKIIKRYSFKCWSCGYPSTPVDTVCPNCNESQ